MRTDKDARRGLASAIQSGLFSRGAMLVAPLLIMPAMLNYLGASAFGIWITGISMTSIAAFLDLGIGNSLLTKLAVYHGQSDEAAARRSIGAAYRILGLVFLCSLSIFTIFIVLGYNGFVFFRPEILFADTNTILIVVVTILFFLAGLPLSMVYRVLYAHQQIPLHNAIQILSAAVSIILTLWVIQLALAPWVVVAAYSVGPVIVMIAASIWYFTAYPQFRPQASDFTYGSEARGLFKLGIGHLALAIFTSVGMNSDFLLVQYVFGSDIVTAFALPSRIGSLMVMIVGTLFMPLWGFNGIALSQKNYAMVRRNTLLMSLGGVTIVFLTGVLLTLGSDRIMLLWVGQNFPDQALIIAMMAIFSMVIAVTSPYNMVLNAAGLVNVQILCWFGFVVISFIAKIGLMTILGPWVVPLAAAVVYATVVSPFIIMAALSATRGNDM